MASLVAPFNPADINGNIVATQIGPVPTVSATGQVTASSTLVNANLVVMETGGIKQ